MSDTDTPESPEEAREMREIFFNKHMSEQLMKQAEREIRIQQYIIRRLKGEKLKPSCPKFTEEQRQCFDEEEELHEAFKKVFQMSQQAKAAAAAKGGRKKSRKGGKRRKGRKTRKY